MYSHGQFIHARPHDRAFAAQQNILFFEPAYLLVGCKIGKIQINIF